MISLIAAMTDQGVIGKHNCLPWQMPADLAYFRQMTRHHCLIMGRKTFESLGKPLADRDHWILTRHKSIQKTLEKKFPESPLKFFENLDSALKAAAQTSVFIIGGAEIYAQALAKHCVDYLYLTFIHADISGDVYFPSWNKNLYQEISRQDHLADLKNPHDYTWVTYKKNKV